MNQDALQLQEDRALIELRAIIDTATKDGRWLTDPEKQTCDALDKSLTEVCDKIGKAKCDASVFTALDDLVTVGLAIAEPRFELDA